MTKGRAVTIIPNGEGSRGFFRLRPQTGEKLYSKANRERKKKAEAVKSEAISRRTKRRLSKPKRKLGRSGRAGYRCSPARAAVRAYTGSASRAVYAAYKKEKGRFHRVKAEVEYMELTVRYAKRD